MKLLVLGASGAVGRWLVRCGLDRGHDVTALVRPSTDFDAPAGVRTVRGEPTDAGVLEVIVQGQEAVAFALGLRRASKSPWAALRSPPDLTESIARLLVPAMARSDVRRLVAVSAGGVGDSRAALSAAVRWLVTRGNVGVAYEDLERMEAVLRESTLDWLAVRPVTLRNGAPTGRSGPVPRYDMTSLVRRSDVAAWMIGALERREPFSQRTVLLGTVPRGRAPERRRPAEAT